MTRIAALILALATLSPAAESLAQVERAYRYRVPLAQSDAALAPASLALSPSDLSFSDLVVGSSSASAFILQNTGAQPLSISSIQASNTSAFTLDSSACPAALAPGDMCAVGMTFAPPSRGSFSGNLLVDYTGGSAQATYSGRGLQGALQASASALVFDPVILPDSTSRSIQISNTGDATVSSVSISADPPFVVSGSCATVTPGQSCNVFVLYEPSAPGVANGTLQVSSPVGSLSIQLSGSAEAGESVASITAGNPILFGSVIQGAAPVGRVVSLRNGGNVAMTITGVQGLPAGVSVQANTCENVAPGANCALTLALASTVPTSFANASASTQGATSNADLSLSGEVQAAQSVAMVSSGAPVSFGSAVQGAAAVTRSVTLTNTGNSPLTVTGLSNLPAVVTLTGNTCTGIAPSGTCTLTLQMTASSVSTFSQNVSTQGATSNATISMSGAVTAAGYPASAFSASYYYDIQYDVDYDGIAYIAGRSVYVRNNTGAALTVVSVNFCPEATERSLTGAAGSRVTSWTHNRSTNHPFCSARTINQTWANGGNFGLFHGTGYYYDGSDYVATYRPNGSGYLQIQLSNGQTLELRSSGLTMK